MLDAFRQGKRRGNARYSRETREEACLGTPEETGKVYEDPGIKNTTEIETLQSCSRDRAKPGITAN